MQRALILASMLISTMPASAADVEPPVNAFRWEGLYSGLHASSAWGNIGWQDPTGSLNSRARTSFPAAHPSEGVSLGGQIGYSHQLNRLVLGGEARLAWSNLDAFIPCGVGNDETADWICHTKTDLLASLAARVGYNLGDILFYVKGGLAVKHGRNGLLILDDENRPHNFHNDHTEVGWMAGLGLEYAIDANWSVQAEYAAYDFGTARFTMFDRFGGRPPFTASEYAHTATVSLNYRLWAPELADWVSPASTASPWQGQFGVRYWLSSGWFQYAFAPNDPYSRLTYSKAVAHYGEAFGRLDYRGRGFIKGYFGAGTIPRGKMIDEDFPSGIDPYSRTLSELKDGKLRYGSIDAGLTLLGNDLLRLGTFLGYHFLTGRMDTYGCWQLATAPYCAGSDIDLPDNVGLSQTTGWRSLRLGGVVDVAIAKGLTLTIDAAYLPTTAFDGEDRHWDRPALNPVPQEGDGHGYHLEAILSYRGAQGFALGLGGRYWTMNGRQTASMGQPESRVPLSALEGARYGVFLQASYDLGL